MTEEDELVKRLLLLKDYYNSPVKDEILTLWAKDLLELYSFKNVKAGIKSYRENETYPPTLAGIINYIPKNKIDYASLILETVQTYGSATEQGKESLKENELAQELYTRYGKRIGMSEPYSISQKFLFKEINDEAECKERYNKTTIGYLPEQEECLLEDFSEEEELDFKEGSE